MNVNTAVFSFKRLIIKDKSLLAVFSAIFFGLLSGPLIYAFLLYDKNSAIFDAFISFNTEIYGKTDIEIFSGIAATVLVYFFTMFFFGSSFIGRPVCICATYFKALGMSVLISCLYTEYGLKGLEYVLLVFFPGKILLLFGMLLMTKSSFDMSLAVKNGIGEKGSGHMAVKAYYLKNLIFLLIFIVSATVDFIALKVFSSLFDFSIL